MNALPSYCFVALDHRHDEHLGDLLSGLRVFCPEADVFVYDSGRGSGDRSVAERYGVPLLPVCRVLEYAKVTPFFFDLFEWATDQPYDYVVNVESDMAFVGQGFGRFLAAAMSGVDHLAPAFVRNTARTSRWRPYRSLRPELPELLSILGIDHTNQCFSPGQVFSGRYVRTLVDSPIYEDLRAFVERNQNPGRSYTLQEVLLPTLPDVLGLTVRAYPQHMSKQNRYRPYHARSSVERAHQRPDLFFVHPVRRDANHPARRFVRALLAEHGA